MQSFRLSVAVSLRLHFWLAYPRKFADVCIKPLFYEDTSLHQ